MSELAEMLPALLVAIPILLAAVPIVLGLRFERTGWSVAAMTTTALTAASVYLAAAVYETGRVVHVLGGWGETENRPQGVGIELVADEFSVLIALLVTITAAGALAYMRAGGPRGNTFYGGYLLLVGGLLGLSLTGDVFNMFVFLEIVGLATYAMIAAGDGPESAVAALKYLILGTVGASLYLIGVGFLFMATGALNMEVLGEAIPQIAEEGGSDLTLLHAAFAFIFVGLVSTVSAYALGRIMYNVFGPEFLTATPYLTEIVVTVGAVSVVAGSALAVIQRDVKRMFAYSSVSQFGLVVAAYGLVTQTAFVGAVVHLIGHGVMKAGLFIAAGLIAVGYGARTVDEYAGFAAGATALLLIALVGIPPSAGFIGKWYIAVGAVQAEAWTVAAVVFLSTMLTIAYAARLLEKMYFTPATPVESPHPPGPVAADGGEPAGRDSIRRGSPEAVSFGMLAILVTIALSAVVIGFAGGAFFEWLEPFTSEVFTE